MSSTGTSSSSDDSDSSDSVIAANTPATRVDARRLFDRMPPGVDLIGALPDGILHYLLSFLPVQEAVRTCVLAKRCRHLWKSTTGLRIVGTKGPGSVRDLRKFVDHLLILRERTDLDTVEIGFSKFRREDVPFVNLWIRFAVQSKVRELSVRYTNVIIPFHLDGLPFASRYLTTLGLYSVRLNGTFLDFSSCPALEDLKISFSVINVNKIVFRSLKHLKIFSCRFFLDNRVRISAPCLVSLQFDGFSGRTPLLERMPLLETAFLNLGASLHHTSDDICLQYSHSGVLCGANDVSCVNCLYNDGSNNSSVLLGAIDNAKHLKLISSSEMIIFTRDLKRCPTFNNLRNLLLNDYWCVGPDFNALTCILKHSPVLENLTLQLVPEGVRPNVEMKGSYSSTERSNVISQHLKIVSVKCYLVDEKVAKVLKFLCTLNLPTITMSRPSTHPMSSSNSKVNSFLYENPFRVPLNGILLEHLPFCYARFDTTSTDNRGDAKEAQDSRSPKAYAWKRRRKRQDDEEEEVGENCQAGPQPGLAGSRTGWPPEPPGSQTGRPADATGLQPGLAGSQTGYPAEAAGLQPGWASSQTGVPAQPARCFDF